MGDSPRRLLALALGGLFLTACAGRALETGRPADAGAEGVGGAALTIPDFVVPPVLTCDLGVGAVALVTPCELGRGPIYETDCAFGAATDQVIRFMLPVSLSLGGNPSDHEMPLGKVLTFEAVLVPTFATLSRNGVDFQLQRMNGALTLTKGSLDDRALDGWFSHLDFIWTAGAQTITCALDNGRFTTIPGPFE